MAAPAPDAVKRLIDCFDQDRKVFQSPGFIEEQIPKASTPHEQEFLQQAIDTADKQVDMLVCESYCLTADGIQIVERRSR